MDIHRRKPHNESLLILKWKVGHWQELISEHKDNAQAEDIENWHRFEEAVDDYEKYIDTEYANDKRVIAYSLGSSLLEPNAERGFRVRSGGGALGKKTKEVLEFARSLLPVEGPRYPRGVPAEIIRRVAKEFGRSDGSIKVLLYRYDIFK